MSDLGIWEPLPVEEVSRLLGSTSAPWWFAGGQAVDAFLGYRSREHGDIDVSCPRDAQLDLQTALAGWELWCAEPPGTLRPWRRGEWLPPHVHDIWCRPAVSEPWRLQLMLDEVEGEDWVYRRNASVRRPLASLTVEHEGQRYLSIEVQLLYKAPGAAAVEKNRRDFEACLPRLSAEQRNWLAWALEVADSGHEWLPRLAVGPQHTARDGADRLDIADGQVF